MSCQINVTASIADVGAIRRCLFPTDDSRGSDSWLQLCELSVSPTGDIVAIANERRLVILSAKWDSTTSLSQFQITYSGSVHESDNVRAVVCVPIVSQTKSSHVVPDWTCVLIGFESGFVRFYTENCDLLLEEQLHNEIITSIKCRSQHNPRPDLAPDLHPEEIYVQYPSTVCVIEGGELIPLLRSCRTELARVQAKGEVLEFCQGNITPKKWGFQDQAAINDVAVVGVNLHGTFDHLLTASTYGGFDTKYRSSAPYNNLVLAAGSRPFLGYHYALEGAPQPVLTDVAKAVATKLKSALPSWLTGSKATPESPMTVAMQSPETMGCRFGLCDLRRTATNIILSPDHKLAALSDTLGRVLLIDSFRGIALRIFKGYRDAQCAFIQVPDERHSKHHIGNKVALFLVIYSPKKGTIEIFTVQQGQKVAAFSAPHFSRLVYNNYSLMGFAAASKSRFICQFDAVLIDNDGLIKEVLIPFHFALSEKNSKRARDLHLFKKLKQLVKQEDCDEQVRNVCSELKTSEVKLQATQLLLSNGNLPAELIIQCIRLFDGDEDAILKKTVENATVLLELFIACSLEKGEEVGVAQTLESELRIETKDLGNLQRLLDLSRSSDLKSKPKVAFVDCEGFAASDFVAVFDVGSDWLRLRQSVDDAALFKAAELIFARQVVAPNVEELSQLIRTSKLNTRDVFFLLVHYWVNRPFDDHVKLEREMNNLHAILTSLVEIEHHEAIWREIREILANSPKPFPALTAAILFRLVAEDIDPSDEDNIEILTQESVEWSLLIGKLEDVSLLNITLSNKAEAKLETLPKLKHDAVDVSLRYILDKGKGAVSELVGRWLTTSGIDPELIVLNDQLIKSKQRRDSSSSSSDDDDELPEQDLMPQQVEQVEAESLFERLNLLKFQFPYSLESGNLLANMCWEYALAWQRDIDDLTKLEACADCLSHIPSAHLREGLSNLLWNAHLKLVFESTAKLMNKAGRLPKERLCKQDTGLSDRQMALFLRITTAFLDSYMDALRQSCGLAKPPINFEPVWEEGPQALVELALQQSSINYDLLHLHYQLSLVLEMTAAFALKHPKPINSLYESYMTGLFFVDLQTKTQINWGYCDTRVQSSRFQFLCKAISASLETVRVSVSQIYASDHIGWMLRILDLAKLWNLDLDRLRRFELVQVYTNGFDSFGDELFRGVEDKSELGAELLAVAGKRLSQFLTTSPNLCQNVVALSTAVTRYVEQWNGDWCAPSDLEGIENLANRSLSCLDENQQEYKIAELLLDGCQTLRNIYKES